MNVRNTCEVFATLAAPARSCRSTSFLRTYAYSCTCAGYLPTGMFPPTTYTPPPEKLYKGLGVCPQTPSTLTRSNSFRLSTAMPAQRPVYPRRRNPESRFGPATRRNLRRLQPADSDSLAPGVVHTDVATPVGSREVSTEPATPPSPIFGPRSNPRALRRERSVRFPDVRAVFQYNRFSNDLKPWFWYGYCLHLVLSIDAHENNFAQRPVDDAGERVTPSDLLEYRNSHDFRGPSCMCASLDLDTAAYTESAIFVATCGPSTGKYVAACATGQCRYWGTSILLRSQPAVYVSNLPLHPARRLVCLEQLYSEHGLLVKRYAPRGQIMLISLRRQSKTN